MEKNSSEKSQLPSGNWKIIGIVSLAISTLCILFAFIPCLNKCVLYFGLFGVVLSIISLFLSMREKARSTLGIIVFIVSVFSVSIGFWQHSLDKEKINGLPKNSTNNYNRNKIMNEVPDSTTANDSTGL